MNIIDLKIKKLSTMKQFIKNKTIRIFSLGVVMATLVTFGIFMPSCSSEEDHISTYKAINRQDANSVASEYLELVNNQYVLNLSEEKASALGISRIDYDRIQMEICQANTFIIECLENGEKIELTDPQNIKIDNSNIRLKSETEYKKSDFFFSLSSSGSGGSGGSGSAFAPLGVKSVTITLTSACLVGTCSGKVVCGGVDIPYTIVGWSGGSKTVQLPMSNTNVTIQSSTACSNGGYIVAIFNY